MGPLHTLRFFFKWPRVRWWIKSRTIRMWRRMYRLFRLAKVRWWVKSRMIRTRQKAYRLGSRYRKIWGNVGKPKPALAKTGPSKFIPASNIEIMLTDIPGELEFLQRHRIIPTRPKLCWSPVERAQEYEIAIKALHNGKWHYFGNIKGTKFSLLENLSAGEYQWKVRAGGDRYSQWSLPAKFAVDNKGNSHNIGVELKRRPLEQFIPAREVKVEVEEIPEKLEFKQRGGLLAKLIGPKFNWFPVREAQVYEIALKDTLSGKWHYFGNIKGKNFSLPENLSAGEYLWKVRAGGDRYSKWSLPAKFAVDNKGNSHNIGVELKRRPLEQFIPAREVKLEVEEIPEKLEFKQRGGLLAKLVEPNFRWSPVKGAQHYELASKNLQIGKWHYFGNIKYTKFCLPENLDTGKYLWKVRAGGDRYSQWSLPAKFSVDNKGNSHNISLDFHRNVSLKKRELRQGKVKLRSAPIQLAVILEGRGCNISCIYCSHKLQTKSRVKLYPKLIDDLANYLPSVKTVSFGGSEPMIYPEFRQICDMVENYPETQLSICTNGMLIDEYWAERFCEGNFPWIRISIDGATPSTYAAIRRGGNLETILHGVDLINRSRQKKKTPRLQWNFVVTTLNFHEMIDFLELAHRYDIDVVNFQGLIVERNAPARRPSRKNLIEKRTQISILENEAACSNVLELLAEAESLAGKYGIRIIDQVSPRMLGGYVANSEHTTELIELQRLTQPAKGNDFFCYMPFINLSFGDGRAHFCCYAKEEFLSIPYRDDCKKIDEIWNSPKFQEARQLMYENPEEARSRICEPRCPHYSSGLRSTFLQ